MVEEPHNFLRAAYQGEAISPYLFILKLKMLLFLIKKHPETKHREIL